MNTVVSDVMNGSTSGSRKKDGLSQDRLQSSSLVESDTNHAAMQNGHSRQIVASGSTATRLSTPIITPSGHHIERESFVRMLTQTLTSLGYQNAASQLQQESGVEFEAQTSTQFRRAICLGEWDNARSMCQQLKFDPPSKKHEFLRLFAEQKYVHMIEQVIRTRDGSQSHVVSQESIQREEAMNGSSSNGTHVTNSTAANGTAPSATDALIQAVQYLQTELAPLLNLNESSTSSATAAVSPAPTSHMLHLASLFTCTSIDALRSVYQGECIIAANNSSVTADQSSVYYPLFQRCIPYLSHSSLVMNDNQLLSLLDQSIRSQIDQCPFHHERASHTFDLNQRHQCALTLPDKPLITLNQHSDEILHLAFSHSIVSGKPASTLRLATCSKDGTIQVYNIKFKHHTHHRRRSSQSTSRMQLEGEKQTNGQGGSEANHVNGKSENGNVKVLNGFTHHPGASLAAATTTASSTLSSINSSNPRCASDFEVHTQCILRPPASASRAGTPSPSASSGSASPSNSAAVYTVSWSPDNEYLLAYNGEEASVFHVEDGVCVLTVGAKAVDTLAAAAIEAVNAAASTAAATTSTSVPAIAGSQADASSSRSGSFSIHQSASPSLPSQQHSLALQHVSRLLSSPLLQSISQFHASINDFNARRSAAAGSESQSGNSSSASSEHENIMGHAEPITACAWCADSCTFVTGSADRRLILWDLTGEILDVWTGDMIQDITIVANRMIVSTPQSKIIVFQIQNRKLEECESMQESTYVTSVGLSNDARYALVNLMRPAEIHMWNLGPAPDQIIPSASANFVWPQSVTDSRMDTSVLSSSSSASAFAAAPTTSRTPIGSVHPSALPLISPEPSPHASSLVHRYSGFFASRYVIRSCFGGPSEHLVISGSEDGLVYIWHRESQKLLKALRGHTSTVNSIVACEFQGHYLFASASDDNTAKIWRIDSQQHSHGLRTEGILHSNHAHNGHHHSH